MITRFGLLVCAGASLFISTAPAQNVAPRSDSGDSPAAQVTIPYQEFKRLLDAATEAGKPEDSPDLSGAVSRAVVKLSLDPNHPGRAEFEINTFGHKWVFVPFFGLDLPVTNVASEGAVIVPRDGVLCLLTNHPGVTKVTLDFDLPGYFLTGTGGPISIQLAPVTSGQLEFSNLPAGKRILIKRKPADINKPLPLSAAGAELKVSCVVDKPESPITWSQITQTLVKPALESIEIESHIHLTGGSGSGLSAIADLPVTADKVAVEGADLQPTQIHASGSGHKQIALTWATADILDRNIIIRYELPNPEPGRPWEVTTPRFGEELEPQSGLVAYRDVAMTLQGRYGARTTLQESDPKGWILYVAAPIIVKGNVWGVAAVYKPQRAVEEFLRDTERTLTLVGLSVVIVCTLIGAGLSRWVTAPLAQLTHHAIAISKGERPAPLRLPGRHLRVLGESLEQMRDDRRPEKRVRAGDHDPSSGRTEAHAVSY